MGWAPLRGSAGFLGRMRNTCLGLGPRLATGFRCGSELAAPGRAMERMWGEEPAEGSCQTFSVCLG